MTTLTQIQAVPHNQLVPGRVYRIHTMGRTGLVRAKIFCGELSYEVLSNGRVEPVRCEPLETVFEEVPTMEGEGK